MDAHGGAQTVFDPLTTNTIDEAVSVTGSVTLPGSEVKDGSSKACTLPLPRGQLNCR